MGVGEVGTDCSAPFSSPSPPIRAPDPNHIWFTLALFGSNHLTSCYHLWVPHPHLWEGTAHSPLSLQQILYIGISNSLMALALIPTMNGQVTSLPPGYYSGCPPMPGVPPALVAPTHILPGLAQTSRNPIPLSLVSLTSWGAASSVRHCAGLLLHHPSLPGGP